MKLFISNFFIPIILIAAISCSDSTPKKALKIESYGDKKPTEMSKEEAEKHKAEKDQVKKMLEEYNQKRKEQFAKKAKEQQKDEKLQEVLKEIKAAREKHPEEKRKPTKSIPEINTNVADGLYEGDIELNLEQAEHLIKNSPIEKSYDIEILRTTRALRRMRRGGAMKAVTFPNNKWPINVPFTFDATISSDLKSNIYGAIKLWYDNTCLNLYENASKSPRIQFTRVPGIGCKSSLGMQSSSTYQNVWLDSGCERIGIIAHEIGHALGFYHEQSRYDRDSFVWYYSGNVNPNETYNFDLQTSETDDNYQIAYDLGSDMHYGPKAFSVNDSYTLVPKAGAQYVNTIGRRFGPSFSDYLVMNRHYCGLNLNSDGSSQNTVSCPSSQIKCSNDGFQDPNRCTSCICPPGFVGSQCQNVDTIGHAPVGVPNTCNGTIIHATSAWQDLYGIIGSDSLDSNTDYAYCHWQILADPGKTISIQVVKVGYVCADSCAWGNTEIRTSANKGATGLRICCAADLGSTGQLQISAPNGYAMISLYSLYYFQRFQIRFQQV